MVGAKVCAMLVVKKSAFLVVVFNFRIISMIDCEKECVNYGTSMCAYPKFKHHNSCINFKSKVMAKKQKKQEVKFINSLALAAVDKDSNVRHFQIVIVQELESGEFRLMFDVVDPSKIKLDESNVPSSPSA